jgi:glycosyltransferase involved in cell wall biosynthesis
MKYNIKTKKNKYKSNKCASRKYNKWNISTYKSQDKVLKGGTHPLLSVFLMCYNEERIIDFTVKYYKRQFPGCIITICDNESTDHSVKIAKWLGCEIYHYSTRGVFNEMKLTEIRNNIWKKARTRWVIVCDMDEILTANQNDILAEQEKGTTILKTKGYELYANSKREDLSNIKTEMDTITQAKYSKNHSKNICFDRTKITDINFSLGSHTADPKGEVKFSEKEYFLYHYKHLGYEYYKFTHVRSQPRALLAQYLGIKVGNHYTLNDARLKSNSNTTKMKLEEVPMLKSFYIDSKP